MLDTTLRKWVSRLLIFTFACLCLGPVGLAAKKGQKGARVLIERLDGQFITGELLKVEGSDLLLGLYPGTGYKISINDIKQIQVKKKSKFLQGALLGFGACVIASGFMFSGMESEGMNFFGGALLGGIFGAPIGILSGGIASSATKGYKTYQVAGADPATISEVLVILDKRARF